MDVENIIVPEEVVVKPKTKTQSRKDRQIGRVKKYIPDVDVDELSELLDDQDKNKEEIRLMTLEKGGDPKLIYNNLYSKKLVKYIEEYKEETIEDVNDIIENAKEEIGEAVEIILDDKKELLMESLLNKFEMLVELLGSKLEDFDKVKDKYDEMVDDMENRLVENTDIKPKSFVIQNTPTALDRMLRRV